MNIHRPTQGQLEAIETQLRLYYAAKGKLPKLVRQAPTGDAEAAWKNEALRYWYVCLRRGVDPMEMEHHVEEVINAEIENPDWGSL